MIRDLIKVEDRISFLLEKYPETRDNDKLLWLAYTVMFEGLREHLQDYDVFKRWLLRKDTPVFESLSRARRKIQETRFDLRGEGYRARKDEEEEVKEWSRAQ